MPPEYHTIQAGTQRERALRLKMSQSAQTMSSAPNHAVLKAQHSEVFPQNKNPVTTLSKISVSMSNVGRDDNLSQLRTRLRGTSLKVSGVVSKSKWEKQEQRACMNNDLHDEEDVLSGRAQEVEIDDDVYLEGKAN